MSELAPGQLFLDFGCGIKHAEELAENAVLLDAIHFSNVDVVSTTRDVPFKDDSFALIVSQAVFEHLPDPFHTAREMLRILKPGGRILIDTAFMQPFHADPDHYFNMTTEGLRAIMQGFEILEIGVQPHQMPSCGLIMQIETVLPLMRRGGWRDRLDTLLTQLQNEGLDLDRDLGVVGQQAIAAGVFVVARKPRSLLATS